MLTLFILFPLEYSMTWCLLVVNASGNLQHMLVLTTTLYCRLFCSRQAPGLPKTRSGKIMRRVLRKIAAGQEDELGDISTLADPSVVKQLLETR